VPDLTIAEEVVLLALDGTSGAGKLRLGLDYAVAGAVIVELALAQRIDVDDDDVITVLDAAPTGIAHLDAELDKVVRGGGMKVGKALRRTHKSALDRTVAALVDRGVLRRRTKRILGIFPVRRYPAAEWTTGAELRTRLSDAVRHGHQPDERTAALIGVLNAGKLWSKALPGRDRKRVKARMAEIADGQAVSPSVRRAVVRTQGAIIAMAAAASSGH